MTGLWGVVFVGYLVFHLDVFKTVTLPWLIAFGVAVILDIAIDVVKP